MAFNMIKSLSIPIDKKTTFLGNLSTEMIFIQSAYWIFPLFFFVAFVDMWLMKAILATLFIIIRIVHTYLSMYLCLGNPSYRSIARKQILRFYIVPGLLVGLMTLFFVLPFDILPWDLEKRFKFYSFVVFPLTYWHYASQHYGVLSIYRARAKQSLSHNEIWWEKFFCHFTTGFLITMLTLKNFYDVQFANISFKEWLFIDSVPWSQLTVLIVIPLTILMVKRELQYDRPSLFKILYFISISLMTSVIVIDNLYISWMLIDLQHFLVVMGLGGHMLAKTEGNGLAQVTVKTNEDESERQSRFWKYMIILIFISITMSLVYYYFDAHGIENKSYGIILGWMPQHPKDLLQVFFYGLFIAIGICHYYYDRLAFRFSDKDIGRVAKELI